MSNFVFSHRELVVYQSAFEAAMQVFELSQAFPEAEQQRLTDQMVRSSRSVCANLAEAWQRRRYKKAFIAKLNEVEAEAAETQTWIEFAVLCDYLDAQVGQELFHTYTVIMAASARLIDQADAWVVPS